MLKWMLGTVKALLLTGLSFVTLILRCGRKKKLASGGYTQVDQSQQHKLPHNLNNQSAADEEWDRWDDGPTEVVVGTAAARPNSVEDHIRAYREAKRRATEETEMEEDEQLEPERDLLASLEPTVVRQKKVYVGARSTPSTEYRRQKSSRLGVQESVADPLLAKGGELEDWGSNEPTGWQAEDEGTLELVREVRREQRQQRSSLS